MHHFQLEVPRNPLHPKHVCTNLQNPRKELNTRRKKSSTLYNNLNSRCNKTDTIFISICSRNLPTFMYWKIPKLKIGQNILPQTDVHCWKITPNGAGVLTNYLLTNSIKSRITNSTCIQGSLTNSIKVEQQILTY